MTDATGGSGSTPTPGFDELGAAAVLGRALQVSGGAGLVLDALRRLPGSTHQPGGRGLFTNRPETVQVGTWRYQVDRDGRLRGAHVVGGIVIAERVLAPTPGGAHVAAAIAEHLGQHGAHLLPDVQAVLAGVQAATA